MDVFAEGVTITKATNQKSDNMMHDQTTEGIAEKNKRMYSSTNPVSSNMNVQK